MPPADEAGRLGCQFCLSIVAPDGLQGIAPGLLERRLALRPYTSGYNGKVILKATDAAPFTWSMDATDAVIQFASGFFPGHEDAAATLLRSLSEVLKAARFAHQILLDDRQGNLHLKIEYGWPPDAAA
ncbi:MAG: hypothetical protein NW223_19515 [Hyphomicrobiaceae bacterium]|nr:hypothetical protein [Hyphomicrobiaceae bacterium]